MRAAGLERLTDDQAQIIGHFFAGGPALFSSHAGAGKLTAIVIGFAAWLMAVRAECAPGRAPLAVLLTNHPEDALQAAEIFRSLVKGTALSAAAVSQGRDVPRMREIAEGIDFLAGPVSLLETEAERSGIAKDALARMAVYRAEEFAGARAPGAAALKRFLEAADPQVAANLIFLVNGRNATAERSMRARYPGSLVVRQPGRWRLPRVYEEFRLVKRNGRMTEIGRILGETDPSLRILLVASRRRAEEIAGRIAADGVAVESAFDVRTPAEAQRLLDRAGGVRCVASTEVAAKNFAPGSFDMAVFAEPPTTAEQYERCLSRACFDPAAERPRFGRCVTIYLTTQYDDFAALRDEVGLDHWRLVNAQDAKIAAERIGLIGDEELRRAVETECWRALAAALPPETELSGMPEWLDPEVLEPDEDDDDFEDFGDDDGTEAEAGAEAEDEAEDDFAWLEEAYSDFDPEAGDEASAAADAESAEGAEGEEASPHRRTLTIRAGYVPHEVEGPAVTITEPLSSNTVELRAAQARMRREMKSFGRMTHQMVGKRGTIRRERKREAAPQEIEGILAFKSDRRGKPAQGNAAGKKNRKAFAKNGQKKYAKDFRQKKAVAKKQRQNALPAFLEETPAEALTLPMTPVAAEEGMLGAAAAATPAPETAAAPKKAKPQRKGRGLRSTMQKRREARERRAQEKAAKAQNARPEGEGGAPEARAEAAPKAAERPAESPAREAAPEVHADARRAPAAAPSEGERSERPEGAERADRVEGAEGQDGGKSGRRERFGKNRRNGKYGRNGKFRRKDRNAGANAAAEGAPAPAAAQDAAPAAAQSAAKPVAEAQPKPAEGGAAGASEQAPRPKAETPAKARPKFKQKRQKKSFERRKPHAQGQEGGKAERPPRDFDDDNFGNSIHYKPRGEARAPVMPWQMPSAYDAARPATLSFAQTMPGADDRAGVRTLFGAESGQPGNRMPGAADGNRRQDARKGSGGGKPGKKFGKFNRGFKKRGRRDGGSGGDSAPPAPAGANEG